MWVRSPPYFRESPKRSTHLTFTTPTTKIRNRLKAIETFNKENPDAQKLPEAEKVLFHLEVDDYHINIARCRLNECVFRLAPYPTIYPKRRKLAAKTRDFLELLLES